jgi:hypothetical protein
MLDQLLLDPTAMALSALAVLFASIGWFVEVRAQVSARAFALATRGRRPAPLARVRETASRHPALAAFAFAAACIAAALGRLW